MDPSLYSTRRGGLPLHELIAALEDSDIDSADIYIAPPDDGQETDQDSDRSDDEHEGNVNHLGRAMLQSEVEVILYHNSQPGTSSDQPESSPYDMQDSSDDDLPLLSFVQPKSTLLEEQGAKKRKLAKNKSATTTTNKREPPKNEEIKWDEREPFFCFCF